MMSRAFLLICTQAFLIKVTTAQCTGAYNRLPAAPCGGTYSDASVLTYPSCSPIGSQAVGFGIGILNPANLAASNGGGLQISSSSNTAPRGVSVLSENVIEGPLEMIGVLPFLGSVAVEGEIPNAGTGAVAYSCGNGEVAIVSEDVPAAGVGLGYGAENVGNGFGYGNGALGLGGVLGYGDALGYGTGLAGGYIRNGITNIGGRGACGCNGLI